MKTQTFSVIGLGLLGGSLGQALQVSFPNSRVLGYSRSRSKINLAKKRRFIHDGSTDLRDVVSVSDVIIICTPVDTIPHLIQAIDGFAKSKAIVTDVGSTKASIVNWATTRKFKNISFVGSHPMAGSHLTGLEYSRKDLYQNAVVFVTKHDKVNARALTSVIALWKRLGAKVVVVDAKRHDRIVAEISQFPHLLSALLVHTVSDRSLVFASTGFRDTTRIAQGDPSLWLPIFTTNRMSMTRLIESAEKQLKRLKTALRSKNTNFLLKFLKIAAKKRQKINLK